MRTPIPDKLLAIAPAGIKRLGRRLIEAFDTPLAPRAANPYATHLPILIGLGRLMKIRRVLELGSGLHSSPCFLDRRAFPDLQHWHAIENDFQWGQTVAATAGADSRAKITLANQPIHRAINAIDLSTYDLIFVDDSADADQRAATIHEVARRCPRSAVVVIHDWEIHAYRRAAKPLPHRFAFAAFNPNTAVGWVATTLDPRQLKSLDRHIQRHAERLAADRLTEWIEVISGWQCADGARQPSMKAAW